MINSKPTAEVLCAYSQLFVPVERPPGIVIEKGEGCYCIDSDGAYYLDFGGGLGVNVLGYSNSELQAVIASEANRLIHCGSEFVNRNAVRFAETLRDLTGFDCFFFCNSGAEANEGALKLARKYFSSLGQPKRSELIAFGGSFHGRTLFTISASGNPAHCRDFGPLVPSMFQCEFNAPDALRAAVREETAAILVETIQCRNGVREIEPKLVDCINQLREQFGFLVIVDEIQTGCARTGPFLSYKEAGLKADIVTLGKGLAGGLPVGVVATTSDIGSALAEGTHGTTFGGGPLVMAAAQVVCAQLRRPEIIEHVRSIGNYLRQQLNTLAMRTMADAGTVTGRGLLVGWYLKNRLQGQAQQLQDLALKNGLIVRTSGDSALRFTPPLCIDSTQVDESMSKLEDAIVQLFSCSSRSTQ